MKALRPSHKVSMVPAVLRNDPCLAARPTLGQAMEDWWAGSLWDPRQPGVGESYGTDFTCESSMDSVLGTLCGSKGEYEPLLSAVGAGDFALAERLLAAGAKAVPALHLALQSSAPPEAIHLLANWCDDLNVWLPEPVVVTWARSFCEAALSSRSADKCRGAVERLDILLCAGADINAVGRGCETALHVIARKLQWIGQEFPKSSKLKSDKPDVPVPDVQRIESNLMRAWHDLVARGADAAMLDGDGLTAVERLSRDKCRELLSSKRSAYGARRYYQARRAAASYPAF